MPGCNPRDARHHSPVAPAAGRAEVNVLQRPWSPHRVAGAHSYARGADGDRESDWGYTRLQGALKNVGHQVGRSTIARMLKAAGIPPGRQRPMTGRTFIRAHWP